MSESSEKPIKRYVVTPSKNGRKVINWTTLKRSLEAMINPQSEILPKFEMEIVAIDEDVLTPDTSVVFTLEDEAFGRLEVAYTPGPKAVAALSQQFSSINMNPNEIVLCTEGSLLILLQKLPQAIADAMHGLLKETAFVTVEQFNGYLIQGNLKRTKWANDIVKWYEKAVKSRLNSRQGSRVDRNEFLKKAKEAVAQINGKITQAKLAHFMGMAPQSFNEKMKKCGFTWAQVYRYVVARK